MAFDIYAEVTEKIVAMLEAGVIPWRSPILGGAKAGWPKNMESGKEYRGVNVFLLAFTAWAKGYESAHWLTFKQANARSGKVKKGEKSSMVVFWKQYETRDAKTDKLITVPLLRYYKVFNVEQCEGVTIPDAPKIEPTPFSPIETAVRIVNGYEQRPEIEHRGSRAYYFPQNDAVHIPSQCRFVSPEEYYSTLFHELAHSTGRSTRLDRGIDTDPAVFGSPEYAREELVAEMAAAFLCGHAGIAPATVENSAAYIAGWIKKLKGDNRCVCTSHRGSGNLVGSTNRTNELFPFEIIPVGLIAPAVDSEMDGEMRAGVKRHTSQSRRRIGTPTRIDCIYFTQARTT